VLLLVRHGESTANAQGLLLGRTDAELTDKGRDQATAVRRLLHDPVTQVRSSPLTRATDTAALLALEVPTELDARWIEVDYGEFECQPLRDVPADVWREWRTDPAFRPAGGETLAEVDERVAAACDELFATDGTGARDPAGDVVVVSHVTPIKAAVAWALGTGGGLSWRLHLNTASVTRIGWGNGAPVLHGFNEMAPGGAGTSQSRRA
jgi:probable phosphoglycerate mutase